MLGRGPGRLPTRGPGRGRPPMRNPMRTPTHLRLTLILVALVVSLAIVAEARADVTPASPADTGSSTVPNVGSTPVPSSSNQGAAGSDSGTVPMPPSMVSTGPGADSTSEPAPPDQGPRIGPADQGPPDQGPPDQAPAPPESGDQPTAANPPPTSTNQTIVQVQVSGCLTHCQGTSQTQSAQQQNVTVQGGPPATSSDTPTGQATGSPQPQGSANATQIQVGCVHDCSGTSIGTTAPPISPGTVSQLLAALGSQGVPGQSPVGPGADSGVQQTSQQIQQGGDDQSQSASQWSGVVQGLVSQSVDEAVQAVNQTTQTIVQVQIGCLFYCTDTHQTQQASQSNTAVQIVAQGVDDATAPVATAVGVVTQFVWQLQIGCLAWCSDTTQEQSASQSNGVVVMTLPQASDPPPTTSPVDPGPAPGPRDPGPAAGPTDPGPAPSGPGSAPPGPPVVAVKPSPAVAVAPPKASAVTAPSSSPAGQWVVATATGQRRPASGAPTGSAPAARQMVATTIVPLATIAALPTRTHRAAPIAGRISSGSWQVEGFRAAPATIPSPGAAPAHGESTATEAVVAAVAALALGLLLLTGVRLRTR